MKAVEEGYELLAPCRIHGELQSGLDGFRATTGEVCARRAIDGNYLVEFAREFRHVLVVIIRAADVNQLRGLFLNGADDFRVTVTGGADGDARVAVEERVAVNVLDPDSRGFLDDEQPVMLDAEIQSLIDGRQEARRRRDFARADEIRDQLAERGITLEDTKDGVRWKRR